MNGLALCAGIGGLDLGLSMALRGAYRTVCYVERDAAQVMRKAGSGGLSRAVLNPLFVEALMGLPIGWTDFAALEMQSCRCKPPMLSESLLSE